MSVNNSYPELPEINPKVTTVPMGDAVTYIQSLNYPTAIKIACYVIFRQESGNGQDGINNYYCGVQGDVGRWPDYLNKHIIGTVVEHENQTGKTRRFVAFDSFTASVDFLADRIQKRGLFVGGTTSFIIHMQINSPEAWAIAYWRSWDQGNATAKIPDNERNGLLSMYQQGTKIFAA